MASSPVPVPLGKHQEKKQVEPSYNKSTQIVDKESSKIVMKHSQDSDSSSTEGSTSVNMRGASCRTGIFYKDFLESNKLHNYSCPMCGYLCEDSESFYNHALISHKKTLYCCHVPGCCKWFESQNGLRNHCKTKHMNVLKCLICDLVCLSPNKLEYHQNSHNIVKNFGCDDCSKTFSTAYKEGQHKKYNCPHNPAYVFKCKHCQAKGVQDPDVQGAEAGLINHLISAHSMCGSYICLFCHKLFVMEQKLAKHNKICSKNHPDK